MTTSVSRKDYRAELAKVWPVLAASQRLNVHLREKFVAARSELWIVTDERNAALLRVEELEAELAQYESGVRDIIDRLDQT